MTIGCARRRAGQGWTAGLALLAGIAVSVPADARASERTAQALAACQDGQAAPAKRIASCTQLSGDKSIDNEIRVEALINLGLAMEASGDDQGATRAYTDAIALDASSSVAFFNRGNVLDRLGQTERALADYNKAIEQDATDPDFYNNRGLLLMEMGQAAKALDDFNAAIRLGLADAGVFASRAGALEKLGKKAEAVADYRKAIELEPGNTEAQEALKRLQ